MLDSFHEEIRHKRRSYQIFWVIVIIFATLLYMFFQGYYFSIRLGFEKLLQAGWVVVTQPVAQSGAIIQNDDFLRSFGIVSLRVEPTPGSMTLNGKPYTNGDKKILDYGKYSIEVRESGYLPLSINVELSKTNPFYLNNVRLLELRSPITLDQALTDIEESKESLSANLSPTTAIGKTASGGYLRIVRTGDGVSTFAITQSGATSLRNTSAGVPWAIRTNIADVNTPLVSLGEGFFSSGNRTFELVNGMLTQRDLLKGAALCAEARMIWGDIFCPAVDKPRSPARRGTLVATQEQTIGRFITGKYQGLTEPILEAHNDFFRTASAITQLGGGFFNSSTPIVGAVSFSGITQLTTYRDKTVIINNGKMYDLGGSLGLLTISGLETVEATHRFGDETLSLGLKWGKPWLVLEDGKNAPILMPLADRSITWAHISLHSGAYFIELSSEVLAYYKGSPGFESIAQGEILGVIGTTIIYNADRVTKSISLGGVN